MIKWVLLSWLILLGLSLLSIGWVFTNRVPDKLTNSIGLIS